MLFSRSSSNLIEIPQAARLLGISQHALERWIRQGGVPCRQGYGRTLFDKGELRAWATSKNLAWLEGENKTASKSVDLIQALFAGGVYSGIPGCSNVEVLEQAVQVISLPDDVDNELLIRKLQERESLASTGLGQGIAVPHPRHPLKESIQVPMVATCFLNEPVDFGAIDQEPVFVLFLMLAPSTQQHLKLLAQLSFCLREKQFLAFLHEIPDLESLCNRVQAIQDQIGRR
ncbi:MAG: PTS sugar transporter subunit IIA [bacterium]|jgi:PTS system nitrogen regulatory IIA component|nr:PTS sugar transporter subunit IIA [bacterium]